MTTLFELLPKSERVCLERDIRQRMPRDTHPRTIERMLDMAASCVHQERGRAMIVAAMKGTR